MARAPLFRSQQLLDAAITLAATGGPVAVTMQGVAAAVGAPSGSVYHRFAGRAELLAEVWLAAAERFQADWWAAVEHEADAGECAAFTVRWARTHRDLAAVLAGHRAEAFLAPDLPVAVQRRAEALRAARGRLGELSGRLLGSTERPAVTRLVFALVTIPLAAVRGPLADSAPIGQDLEDLVREAARALLRGGR